MDLTRFSDKGLFAPTKIADELLTSVADVARTVGVGRETLSRKDRVATPTTQSRLREMIEILNLVTPRFGSVLLAYAWYRSEPLPGYAGQTPMQLVLEGRADEVRALIEGIDAGVHA
jgi:hypothetical protein